MSKSWFESCPHHTPNAGGSVASELHGVCIFCWRDWCSKYRTQFATAQRERDETRKESERMKRALLSISDMCTCYMPCEGWCPGCRAREALKKSEDTE